MRISFPRWLLLCTLPLLAAKEGPDTLFSEVRWQAAVKACDSASLYAPHVNKGRYFNPWMPLPEKGFLDMLKWRVLDKKPDFSAEEEAYLPDVFPQLPKRLKEFGPGDCLVWVGHASFLIRISGVYWLVDPILSDRAMIPKRRTDPAFSMLEIDQIAPMFNILITHNHYDHLDQKTIQALPAGCRVFAPLGLRESIRDMNRKRVLEMDWWQSIQADSSTVVYCLPAQHWSRRIFQRTNRTLWCSFLLQTPHTVIYIGGDSGYFIGYREFAKRFPSIDFALLPMGAYRPRWFMHYSHMNVEEMVQAFHDLNAHTLIPYHWGAFQLGDEPAGAPGLDLKRYLKKEPLQPGRLRIPAVGEIIPIY
ncbi:MAG: hypothetical protein A2293_09440 [Elusimicrobia bacterium RIFOXYB2_FULL_49_7]|nr:MAG: hypothetical protein A2293_09440 [Elusimicrobia bacterium RIFOXYB2_FULL_49_7]